RDQVVEAAGLDEVGDDDRIGRSAGGAELPVRRDFGGGNGIEPEFRAGPDERFQGGDGHDDAAPHRGGKGSLLLLIIFMAPRGAGNRPAAAPNLSAPRPAPPWPRPPASCRSCRPRTGR